MTKQEAIPGADDFSYKNFQLPTAIIFAVTGISRATALVTDIQTGYFDRLLGRCAGKLLALIRIRLGPTLRREVESQDILQQTLLKAFQKIEQFEGSGRDAASS